MWRFPTTTTIRKAMESNMKREYRNLESQGHVLQTEVLVLGSGLSGLWFYLIWFLFLDIPFPRIGIL
jgi:hypothetical protein